MNMNLPTKNKTTSQNLAQVEQLIRECHAQPEYLKQEKYRNAIEYCIRELTSGNLRVATPPPRQTQTQTQTQKGEKLFDKAKPSLEDSAALEWQIHTWLKLAILLYFRMMPMQEHALGKELGYRDKIPIQGDFEKKGIRVVPPAVIRYGAHLQAGVIVLPAFVNIGAYVGENSLIDTWATVGSCAQIGKGVHLSGGVGIGGVIEPVQAAPVIIEDHAFIGSRAIIVEGVLVEESAVLGAGVILTASTPIIDVSKSQEIQLRGRIPAGSVVIPGSRLKKFPAGSYSTPAALIIGQRNPNTDRKTSLEQVIRDYSISL